MLGVILIVLFIYHLYLSGKFSALERQIAELKLTHTSQQSSSRVQVETEQSSFVTTSQQADIGSPVPASLASSAAQPKNMYGDQFVPEIPHTESAFSVWIKQDFLVKLGAFLLLIALGWFVSYAFANNWIGPVGRITLGIVAGIIVMSIGVVRINTYASQGAIFTVLGSTTILLTLFAARGIYDFFTPASALIFMFLTVAFVAFVSVRYQREQLAIASLLLGAIAPLLTNTPAPDITGLSLYLLALVIGTLWVVYRLQSSILTPLSLLIVFLHGIPYLDALSYSDQLLGLMFSFVFTMVFFITNIISILQNQIEKANPYHYFTAMGTSFYLLCWTMVAAPAIWQTPLYLIWMLVFATGSFLVYIKTDNRIPFYIYGGVALTLLAAATADLFDGAVLTVVYAAELAILIVLANNVVYNSLVARRVALLYVGLGMLSLQHIQFLSGYGTFTMEDLFALLAVTISLGISGVSLARTKPDITDIQDQLQPGTTLISIAFLYLGVIIWLVLHQNLPAGEATTISLVIYTIAGLFLYIQGRAQSHSNLMFAGKVIIGGVVLRLLLVDVWQLAITERIIVFFIIGVLLLSTAFLKQKPKVQ